MKTRLLILVGALALALAVPAPARTKWRNRAVARQHLSAVILIQRFAQALYRFLPPEDGGCQESIGEWVDNGDGTFTQEIVTPDCSRITNTSYGGFPSEYDQDVLYSNGIREDLEARTQELFNEAPGKVHFLHVFSTGDRVEYDQELKQEAALDEFGEPIPGLNFWYALVSTGTVTLTDGSSLRFELRQTKAFDCFNFFNGTELPPDICNNWFVHDKKLGVVVPRPDRLTVELLGGTDAGTLELSIPLLDPAIGAPDFTKPATGTMVLGGRRMNVSLFSDNPKVPGWRFWQTSGADYNGIFELGPGFAGRGNAFQGRRPAPRARGRKLYFAARWNPQGVGTVIFPDGQTEPSGPTTGLLEFGALKWSGLAAAFGPTPGL